MPQGAVYVGRPSKWGNPFIVKPAPSQRGGAWDMWAVIWSGQTLIRFDDRRTALADAVDRFQRSIVEDHARPGYVPTLGDIRRELSGRDLTCWCPIGQPCHADLLLEIANAEVS